MIFKLNYPLVLIALACFCCASVLEKNPKAINITQSYISNEPITNNSHMPTLVEIKPGQLMVPGLAENMKELKM